MQYLLLIYDDEQLFAALPAEERALIYAEYRALAAELAASGELRGGDELMPTRTATSLRVRGGASLLTDGPFAETREQLGGYFLVEVANLDRALAIAAKIPSARFGTIEVRPLPSRGM
jgi:hypothetical protein